VITDKLGSYNAALESLAPSIDHAGIRAYTTYLKAHIDRRGAVKRSWPGSNHPAKHSSFCLFTINSKPYFVLAATNYPPLPIDNLAQTLTAFRTTSRVS
jgi:hypothetical protein